MGSSARLGRLEDLGWALEGSMPAESGREEVGLRGDKGEMPFSIS